MQTATEEPKEKIVKETPAPSLAFYLRATMGETAGENESLYVSPDNAGFFKIFLEEAPGAFSELSTNLNELKAGKPLDIQQVYRSIHVLEKQWGFLGFYQMWQLCGQAEELLEPFLDGKRQPEVHHLESLSQFLECCRVQAELISTGLALELIEIADAGSVILILRRQVAELLNLTQNNNVDQGLAFMPTIEDEMFFRISDKKMEDILELLTDLTLTQSDLQEESKGRTSGGKSVIAVNRMGRTTKKIRDLILSIRQVSIRPLFDQAAWLVNRFALMYGKKIELVVEGADIQVDRNLLSALSGPLLQLLKNAVEHGIEDKSERSGLGKSPEGKLKLKATQKAGFLLLEVEDDGRGLDLDKLKTKGLALGILRDEKAPASRVMEMIFKAGVTTLEGAEQGRGVGLDQVETLVESLHGSIRVQSRAGQGCKFLLKVPQSQSLIEGWVVEAVQKQWVLPISQVLKITPLNNLKAEGEQGLPVLNLDQWWGEGSSESAKFAVHVESGSRQFMVLVDEVFGQQQVLVKKAAVDKPNRAGILAEAVLGDGKLGLILDTGELVKFLEQNTQGVKA